MLAFGHKPATRFAMSNINTNQALIIDEMMSDTSNESPVFYPSWKTAKALVRVFFSISILFFGASAFELATLDAAHADLRLCNKSESPVGVSVGYSSDRGWTTEGWWNVEAESCKIILPGDLKSQYYYMFAVDYGEGGEWAGKAFMCTADKIYTIHGINDCLARGFQKTGFFEINTGTQTNWTVQLTEPTQRGTGGK